MGASGDVFAGTGGNGADATGGPGGVAVTRYSTVEAVHRLLTASRLEANLTKKNSSQFRAD